MNEKEIKSILKNPLKFYFSISCDPDYSWMTALIGTPLFTSISFFILSFILMDLHICFILSSIFSFLLMLIFLIPAVAGEVLTRKAKEISWKFGIKYEILKKVSKEYRKIDDLYIAAKKALKDKNDSEIIRIFPLVLLDMIDIDITKEIEIAIEDNSYNCLQVLKYKKF